MANYDFILSSGHGKYVAGANGTLNEVNEARRVVNRVAQISKISGASVGVFHDDTSKSKNTNLSTIVKAHNAHGREVDVSVHFNAHKKTNSPMGVEVLYFNAPNKALATKVSAAIAKASGLKNRGAKQRTDLYFLRNTNKPAILIEVCFVDSTADAKLYKAKFEAICKAISDTLVIATKGSVKTTTTPAKPTTTSTAGNFKIKSGTFKTKAEAQSAINKADSLKVLSAKWCTIHQTTGGFYFVTGTYSNQATAVNALKVMKDKKILWVGSVFKA